MWRCKVRFGSGSGFGFGFEPLGFKRSALRRSAPPLLHHMSTSPAASGTNLALALLCGGSLTAALVYAYKTVQSDNVSYQHRITHLETRSKDQLPLGSSAGPEAVTMETAPSASLRSVTEATVAMDAANQTVAVKPVEAEEVTEEVAIETAATVTEGVAMETAVPVVEEVAIETAATVTEGVAMETAVPVVEEVVIETTGEEKERIEGSPDAPVKELA